MKHLYYLLLLCGGMMQLPLQAQNWRPFRPNGDVHAFQRPASDSVLTMRLDSAALQASDSVYYFNHVMRRASNSNFQWQKSRNNQFGQLLRYNPTQRTYSFFWNGGSNAVFLLDKVMVLKPFARVGETWNSFFTDYGVTTTLVSRGTQVLDGVTDSVATFQFSTGATVVLSKNNGLVSAPVDLLFGVPNAKTLTLARRPAPAGLSYYNPLDLLDLQPGNELGYHQDPVFNGPFACYNSWLLRRVLSRQVTADSVVYRFQQQRQTVYYNTPNCSGSGTFVEPVQVVRIAASLRTGRWAGPNNPNVALIPVNTDLLAYEYRALPGTPPSLMMGYPVVTTRGTTDCSPPARLQQQMLYRINGNVYNPYQAIDLPGWQQQVGQGIGVIRQVETSLVYFVRTVNGVNQTCGSRTNFGTLLPTKAAQRTAGMQAFPNPTAEQVQLRLEKPALAGSCVLVHDALGRLAVSVPLSVGQTTATVSLRDKPDGLYLVQLQSTAGAGQAIRVQKLP